MTGFLRKVAILDCIGFDLQQASRPMQVRFAKCLVHDDGRIERQWGGDKLLCHRANLERGEDIDAHMAVECAQLAAMGYDPPTPRMIERIKAHCAFEWDSPAEPLVIEHQQFIPMDMGESVEASTVTASDVNFTNTSSFRV